jgi:hypothetical protein
VFIKDSFIQFPSSSAAFRMAGGRCIWARAGP